MARDANDWNYHRIHSAQSFIADAQSDMMRCLHRGDVVDVVRDRMVQRLTMAADQLSKLAISHE